ncbi:hypothetical protein H0O02_00205 [Candidatus Micrarchaeota archaeon]|nr:hypothetical protein [Candidatus Micrarchaeota archaeon]
MAVILSLFGKGGNNKGNGKGSEKPTEKFHDLAEKQGESHWSAVFLRGQFEKKPEKKELARSEEIKKEVAESKIPENEKKVLLDLFSTINAEDAWDTHCTSSLGFNYTRGIYSKGQMEYLLKALHAWRAGKIRQYAMIEKTALDGKQGLSGEEKKLLDRMLTIGLGKDDLAVAITMQAAIKFQFDESPAKEKIGKANEQIEVFRHL